MEAGEIPLNIRRRQLLVNYWINLKGHRDSHPTKRIPQANWKSERAQKLRFGWIGDMAARDLGVYEKVVSPTVIWPDTPVWKLETMEVDFKLLQVKKSKQQYRSGSCIL